MSVVMGDALVQGNVVLGHTNQSDIYAAAPIVYLRMNEGTGVTAADSSDAGNNLNGTIGGATWSTSEYKSGGQSLSFDGSNDYVDLGTSATLKPTTVFSWSIWINADNYDAIMRPITAWSSESIGDGYYASIWNYTNRTFGFAVYTNACSGAGTNMVTDDAVLTAETWHHVVVTYSGADTRMRIYIDGALVDSTHSGTAIPSTIGCNQGNIEFALGYNYGGSASWPRAWDGYLDEFSVWDGELTADQVSYLYGGGTPPDVTVGIP